MTPPIKAVKSASTAMRRAVGGRPPSMWQHVRQTFGRAVRETGQALDRLGLRMAAVSQTQHNFYDDPVKFEDHLNRHRQQMPLLHAGRPQIHPHVAYVAPCATLIGSVRLGENVSVWYGAVLKADDCDNADSHASVHSYKDALELESEWRQNPNLLPEQPQSSDSDLSSQHAAAQEASSSSATSTSPARVSTDASSTPTDAASAEPRPDYEASPYLARQRQQSTSTVLMRRFGGGIFIGDDTNIQDGCTVTARVGHTTLGRGVTVGHLAQIHSATVHDYCLIGMGSVLEPGVVVETESFVAAGAVVKRNTRIGSGELWVGNPARKLRALSDKERAKLHYQSSEYVIVASEQQGVMELGGNLSQQDIDAILMLEQSPQDDNKSTSQLAQEQQTTTNDQQLPRKQPEPLSSSSQKQDEEDHEEPRQQQRQTV